MHKDIVEVLKTSRSDLVRALISLPSLAVRHWSKIRVLILATAIFRHEGKQAKVKESKKSTSLGRIISAGALCEVLHTSHPLLLIVWFQVEMNV